MKVIIAGSRQIDDFAELTDLIAEANWTIDEVVSGGCRGVDEMGENWAKKQDIPVKVFHADWGQYGREAGELRNREMAKHADGLILLWDGKSPGSSCMLRESARADVKIIHKIHGMDIHAMEKTEQDILEYYWSGEGRLIYDHSHWEWEIADKKAPAVSEGAVNALIEKGLLESAQLTVLRAVREKIHSNFA